MHCGRRKGYYMGKLRDFLQELPQDERDNVLAPKVVAVKGIFQLAEQDEWPEPEEIRQTTLEPVEPIPPEIIPVWFREWLSDVAYRMQVPLDFVAVGALVAVSSVIGAGCAIRPLAKDNWSEVPNLWGAVVARPSSKKSPALSEVMKPIARLEAAAKELYEAESQLAAAEQEAYKAQKAALASAMAGAAKNSKKVIKSMDDLKWEYAALEEPTVPVRRRYKTNDSTVEKIGELLNQNLRGLLYFRDELVGMLASWEREDRQGDRAFYLECWNGKQPYDTDRIGRGNVFVKNCCLSILGGIQPSKLLAYLIQNTSSLQNDGMVQRFQLLVYPDEVKTWELVDEYQNREALKAVYTIFDRLASMKFTQYGAIQEEDDDRPYFRFNEEAQQIFYEWYRELELTFRVRVENTKVCLENTAN